jgi:hypothetical protein
MKPIVEPDFETLSEIEDVISYANDGQSVKLSSEAICKRHGALRDAARLQALVTISRASEEKTLLLQNKTDPEKALRELCDYAPGLTGIRLNKTTSIGDKSFQRRFALAPARDKMHATENQRYDLIVKGRTVDLCCVSGAEKQFLSPLFQSKNSSAVKNSSSMTQTMTSIFKQINQSEFHNLDADLIEAFGVFGCELFKNTQEHACLDEEGNPYIAHVEGLIASWSDLSQNMYEQDFKGHPKLINFWNNKLSESSDGSKKTLRCMQISFFDTGPGLLGRAFGNKSKSFDSHEEVKSLIECIGKNFTTKKQSGAGNGYPTILSILSKVGGLIRIRTGKQCLFNCFDESQHGHWNQLSDPIQVKKSKEKYLMNFENWSSSQLSEAAGAVVSIIVPLRKQSGQHSLF